MGICNISELLGVFRNKISSKGIRIVKLTVPKIIANKAKIQCLGIKSQLGAYERMRM
jgi:hypothetical protein